MLSTHMEKVATDHEKACAHPPTHAHVALHYGLYVNTCLLQHIGLQVLAATSGFI